MRTQMLEKWSQIFSIRRNRAKLRPKSRDCLDVLIADRHRMVSREELFETVWPDRVVTEQSLFQCIAEIRAVCGKETIRTYPGRGYRWRGNQRIFRPVQLVAAALGISFFAAVVAFGPNRQASTTEQSLRIAVAPSPGAFAAIEHELVDWLLTNIPAELSTGAAAVSDAISKNVDVLIELHGDPENNRLDTIFYTLSFADRELSGRLEPGDARDIAVSLGELVRETFSSSTYFGSNPADTVRRSHRSALSYWMSGETEKALFHARDVVEQDPLFLPGQQTMAGLELTQGRVADATRRIEQMRSTGQREDDAAWSVAADLILAELNLGRGDFEAASSSASSAYEVAIEQGLNRQAGKAAELLARASIAQAERQTAVQWLAKAHQKYEISNCSVGMARIDRELRDFMESGGNRAFVYRSGGNPGS